LSDDIAALTELAEKGPITFGQLVDALEERAAISLLVILSMAFLLIPVPGLSTVASVLFVLLGLSAVVGTRLWLPGWVRRREIAQPLALKMLGTASRAWARVSKLTRPRWVVLTALPLRWLAGLTLLAGIVAFALPIPIPFNNSPPALCMLLIALGLLARDGVMVMLGHVATIVLWAVLFLAGNFLWEMLDKVWSKFG
jgi:hypothetical protein